MDRTLIKRHNFEIAKGKIDRFSRNLPSNPSFEHVEIDGGLFGWGDHKVTGAEMNSFIDKVQDKLISVNGYLYSIIKEFGEVYKAFDYLDGEYINGIIGSVESAEEASKQALKAQKDIHDTVENLKKTVVGLVSLKNKVEIIEKTINSLGSSCSYGTIQKKLDENYNITQIPTIINSTGSLKKKVQSLSDRLSQNTLELKKIAGISEYLHSVEKRNEEIEMIFSELSSARHYQDIDVIWKDLQQSKDDIRDLGNAMLSFNAFEKEVQAYLSKLETYVHLGDIDAIWSDVEGHKINLSDLHEQLNSFVEKVNDATQRISSDILSLQDYRSRLDTYVHLGDIDTIWSDVEGHKTNLSDLYERIDKFVEETNTANAELCSKIEDNSRSQECKNRLIDKKLKIAYGVAYGSAAFSLIQLVLQLIGIL